MFIGQCFQDIGFSQGLVMSLFIAGLAGGFTHCVLMCGPFVLAQQNDSPSLNKIRGALLLPYHLGRMTTYVLLAMIVHSIVNIAFIFSPAKSLIAAPLLALAAVLFLVSAFPKLNLLFPWVQSLRLNMPVKLISKLSQTLMRHKGVGSRYLLGVLLGFMPCGLVVSVLLASGVASSSGHAALAMVAFSVGTMPALILTAFGGKTLQNKFPNAKPYFHKGALVISSLWLFVLASSMVL